MYSRFEKIDPKGMRGGKLTILLGLSIFILLSISRDWTVKQRRVFFFLFFGKHQLCDSNKNSWKKNLRIEIITASMLLYNYHTTSHFNKLLPIFIYLPSYSILILAKQYVTKSPCWGDLFTPQAHLWMELVGLQVVYTTLPFRQLFWPHIRLFQLSKRSLSSQENCA